MAEHSERIAYLLRVYADKKMTEQEFNELFGYIRSAESDSDLHKFMIQEYQRIHMDEKLPQIDWDLMFANVINEQPAKTLKLYHQSWVRYAAAIIIFFGIGMFWWMSRDKQQAIVSNKIADTLQTPVMPGGNKAILTLADGSQIVLDSTQNGVLSRQGNVSIVKLANGQLAYNFDGSSSGTVSYNTMSTPRGGQYQLTLHDGTKVWLNSSSSIRFPVMFAGTRREVEVTGEAYFEVAENKKMPFRIKIGEEKEIEVLGTHFNVNAYPDEPTINTSLLKGAVRVKGENSSALLTPGQQARFTNSGEINVVNDIDLEGVVAWKNGFFDFDGLGIKESMRQLERWYDIKVTFENEVTDIRFVGKISRNINLSDLLEALKGVGVRFRLEDGRRLVVLP